MATLRILSAGAAQAVTERMIEAFKRDTGHAIAADFGAVGAMKARVTGGESVDVIILTQALIDELIGAGLVQSGSRVDLGKVGTGVAVRAGTPLPEVSDADALRASLVGAKKIVFPDPAIATAGKVVMSMMEKLGVLDTVRAHLKFFPNGYAAMGWLAQSEGSGEIGITQVSEVVANKGVTYVGPLPDEFQQKAMYSAAIASAAAQAALAREFIGRFAAASARPLLQEAGYELS